MNNILKWLAIGMSLAIASCNSSAPPAQERNEKAPGNPFTVNSSPGVFAALFQAYRTTFRTRTSTMVNNAADVLLFDPDSSVSLIGGDAFLNGIQLELSGSSNGSSYHNSYTPLYETVNRVPLAFDGSNHVFRVAGNSYFAPLMDSLKSPTSDVNVSSPTPFDTLSKSAGFTITWTPGNAETAYLILSDTLTVAHKVFVKAVPDNGSYTVTQSDMQTVAPGPVRLSVAHGNFKQTVHPDGRKSYTVIYAEDIISTHLRP